MSIIFGIIIIIIITIYDPRKENRFISILVLAQILNENIRDKKLYIIYLSHLFRVKHVHTLMAIYGLVFQVCMMKY